MRKKALFISSLLFLSLSLSGQYISPGYPHFKNLTIAEGLTNNEVKSFFQDLNGFIWLGTGSGVDRFDGYDFKPFRPYIHHEYEVEKLSWRPIRILIGQNGNFYLGS
ncbi:MAG: hypothetical protein KDD99_01820, partial [Bacteroidetes bacterium]|nr:hypothetical protein [Bacteroidota bacterium]